MLLLIYDYYTASFDLSDIFLVSLAALGYTLRPIG
jgi:hypothetical protein